MITFGLTGGIASGKSTVTKTFFAHNIPMIDADLVARDVVRLGSVGLETITKTFGKDILLPDGTLNRTELGSLVFKDKLAMDTLNAIMGPLINAESDKQLLMAHNQGNQIVGYDAALIVESGHVAKYQPLILVHCSKEMQLDRLMKRNGFSEEHALARINSQLSVEYKLSLSTYNIDSSGTIESSIKQTEVIIESLHVLNMKRKLASGEMTYNQVPYRYRDTAGYCDSDEDYDD